MIIWYIILKHRQAILSVEKLYYFLFFPPFFQRSLRPRFKISSFVRILIWQWLFLSIVSFFFISPAFPLPWLHFSFFSLLCLPALLTVFLSPPFLIFLPYFPPHIHLQNQRKFITILFHPPSLLIPFARAISFHIFRISTFLFLKKVYTYIFDKRNILYSAASNSNSSLEQNYNPDEIYMSDVTVDVTKWKI